MPRAARRDRKDSASHSPWRAIPWSLAVQSVALPSFLGIRLWWRRHHDVN
jgi:hypothetical protein